jgi:quinol monooxygenase YgiN
VIVQASSLTLASRRHIAAFLLAAIQLRRTARRSPGFAGLGLTADLRRRTFYTLSAWTDDQSLDGFVGHHAHVAVMKRFGPLLSGSHFVTWHAEAARPATGEYAPSGEVQAPYPPTWADAHDRLQERVAR